MSQWCRKVNAIHPMNILSLKCCLGAPCSALGRTRSSTMEVFELQLMSAYMLHLCTERFVCITAMGSSVRQPAHKYVMLQPSLFHYHMGAYPKKAVVIMWFSCKVVLSCALSGSIPKIPCLSSLPCAAAAMIEPHCEVSRKQIEILLGTEASKWQLPCGIIPS